ncbi:MAG: DUF4115 domain-containing protein [Candidatus Aminicenantes bacterium]|nr:DUF4115 domain-containing protein [Candidatus Aminicenantes bacterium]
MRLEEIAAATRINRRFLAALEEDDFAAFRSDFFARSVIRAYAKSVGLDEKEILARYEPRARRAQSRAPNEEAARRRPHAKPLPSPLKNAVFFIFSATAIGLTLFVFLKNRDEKPEPPAAAERQAVVSNAPAVPVPDTPSESSAFPAAGPAPSAPPAESQELILELAFTDETWIQAFADGAVKLDGLRPAGATARIEAGAEILLHLGNAGGVAGALNGRPLKSFGASGAVVKNIRITPDTKGDFWK